MSLAPNSASRVRCEGSLVPTTSILLVLGAISAYTFHLLGRLTAVAAAESSRGGDGAEVTSIGQLWDLEVGESTSWLVSLAVMITCYGTCLAYSITLGDTFRGIAATAGLTAGALSTRRFGVALVGLLGVYPMCRLRSLAALAPVSRLGVVGILATCAVMAARALPGGGYSTAAGTAAAKYLASLPPDLRPSFGVTGLRGPSSLLVVSSMAATAFLVHMSGPDFYRDLRDPTPARFAALTAVGFSGTAAISVLMMCLGFLTFGGASGGMILNNYSTSDAGATLCRILMGMSLLGSYGFLSNALKNAYYRIIHPGARDVSDEVHLRASRWLAGTVTALALLVDDAGFVVGLNGAVLGSALIYVIPPFLFLRSTARRVRDGTLESTTALRIERWWNGGLICLGAFLALAGAWMSVVNSFFPHLL
jgi:sodium-coupled neutral amino acid transporter 11